MTPFFERRIAIGCLALPLFIAAQPVVAGPLGAGIPGSVIQYGVQPALFGGFGEDPGVDPLHEPKPEKWFFVRMLKSILSLVREEARAPDPKAGSNPLGQLSLGLDNRTNPIGVRLPFHVRTNSLDKANWTDSCTRHIRSLIGDYGESQINFCTSPFVTWLQPKFSQGVFL